MMKKDPVKVLLVLWTKALFLSRPCMNEIATALENDVKIVVLRCEDIFVDEEEQWPLKEVELDDDDKMQEYMLKRGPVVEFLKAQNSIPTPGNTILTMPSALDQLVNLPQLTKNR